jgi:hypothetical protein
MEDLHFEISNIKPNQPNNVKLASFDDQNNDIDDMSK